MTEYVSQGDGFLMNDNDPTRPMVMYYHNLIMQYAVPEGLQFGPAKLPVDTDDQYLRKVVAAGGFRNYEKAHRQALAKTFARVVFPRLPVDAMSHVVAFAFHTGGY